MSLEGAIHEICPGKSSKGEFTTTKLKCGYLFRRGAKILREHFFLSNNSGRTQQLETFLTALKINWKILFGTTPEGNKKTSLNKYVVSSEPPTTKYIERIRNYISSEMDKYLSSNYIIEDREGFETITTLVLCRLTLFNPLCCSNPGKLLLQDWTDALTDKWVNKTTVDKITDPLEKFFFGKYKIAYQMRQDQRVWVPVVIPSDVVPLIEKLMDARARVGVIPENG